MEKSPVLEKIKKKLPTNFTRSVVFDYVFATMLPLLALELALIIDLEGSKAIYTFIFFPIVVFGAWRGGYKTGIVATLVSTVIIAIYFLPPFYSFVNLRTSSLAQVLLFLTEGTLISIVIEIGKRQNKFIDFRRNEKILLDRVTELEKATEEARKEIKSRDEFLSIASHELKTPLTSMLLQTQTALYSIRNVSLAHFSIESLLKMLESVEHQIKRLTKMINDLLNISLITTGNLHLEYEEEDLSQIVEQVLVDFKERIDRGKHIVSFKEKEEIVGSWDTVRIAQAVSNLLSNAMKYGNHKPIELKTKKEHGYARFIVKDHGIGISQENQERIFGLFERGVSPNEYKGLGVGLYITSQITHAHGGRILLKSKRNEGSTFIIELPVKKTEQK